MKLIIKITTICSLNNNKNISHNSFFFLTTIFVGSGHLHRNTEKAGKDMGQAPYKLHLWVTCMNILYICIYLLRNRSRAGPFFCLRSGPTVLFVLMYAPGRQNEIEEPNKISMTLKISIFSIYHCHHYFHIDFCSVCML